MTTNTKERTEQGASKKGTPFLVEVDLRDYFAAKALQGMLADHTRDGYKSDFAELAYGYADAMLKAREIKE